jgi:hypothetical protein
MREARIHPHGGPKRLTEPQREVAEALVADGTYVYTEKVQGKSIVAAFRRYLESGDAEKITHPLYHFITMKCGYIAHFDLHGFRSVYADPADLLKGEMYADVWYPDSRNGPIIHSASVYTDGMTDQEVYRAMVAFAVEYREAVQARSAAERTAAEMERARELALKHGYRLERLDP